MIVARDTVTRLSEVTGFERTSVKTVDMHMSKTGLRARGSGRTHPAMTRREMMELLIGVMGSPVLVNAASYILDVRKFRTDNYGVETVKGSVDALPDLIGLSADQLSGKALMDALLLVIDHLVTTKPEGFVGLRVETNGPIYIQVDAENFIGEIQFKGAVDTHYGDARKSTTVTRRTLEWIGHNGAN